MEEEIITAEAAEPAEQTQPEQPAEEQPAAKKPKKKHRIFLAVLWAVTLIFAAGAGVSAYAVSVLRDKEKSCEATVLPEGLTAEGTVRKYFEYWNAGNNTGMKLAALPDVNIPREGTGAFVAGLCWFCDISLDRCEELHEKAEGYEGCYESAVVSVDFTYEKSFGFGDGTIPEKNTNWEFCLAKINEGDPYRIIEVKRQDGGESP